MRHSDELKKLIGLKLAKLFLDGKSKVDCIKAVYPKMAPDTARKNAGAIFRRFNVVQCVLELYPIKLGDQDCERLLNHLIPKAVEKGDDYLILQIVDRIAKLQGRYSEKVRVESVNLEEESIRLREAEAILMKSRIDPSRINLN